MNYPEFVDKKEIAMFPPKITKYRYRLDIPFNGSDDGRKPVAVILKNPSEATNEQADKTICRVCHATHYAKYPKVIILNLFPYRSANPEDVSKFIRSGEYDRCMEKNYAAISSAIQECDDVIVAWGVNTIKNGTDGEYEKVKKEILKITGEKNLYEARRPEPLHGLRWRNNTEFTEYQG